MRWKKINRELYDSITLKEFPVWICPSCNVGSLSVVEGSFHIIESVQSKKQKQEQDWRKDWIEGSFHGMLKCGNVKCKEVVQIIGEMYFEEEIGDEFDEVGGHFYVSLGYEQKLRPLAFYPIIKIFTICTDVPKIVTEAIIETFKLYWIDIGSCANKIRNVIEIILDEQKIPRTPNKNKDYTDNLIIHEKITNSIIDKLKLHAIDVAPYASSIQETIGSLLNKQRTSASRKEYNLHQRIEKYKEINSEIADLMMSIKWIGNEGSHNNNGLTRSDILDAYDILDVLTIKLYEKDSEKMYQQLTENVKEINITTKPISHKMNDDLIIGTKVIVDEL